MASLQTVSSTPRLQGCTSMGLRTVPVYDRDSAKQARQEWGCSGVVSAFLHTDATLKLLIIDLDLMYADRESTADYMEREARERRKPAASKL